MFDGDLTRFQLSGKVVHRNGQQFVDGDGFASDGFEDVHRPEPFGFATYPIKGGIGVAVQSRGNRDSIYVLGGEHPDHRPDLGEGESAQYDQWKGLIKLAKDGLEIDVAQRKINITGGDWKLKGDVTLDGPLTVNGGITMTPGEDKNFTLNGNLHVNGAIHATDAITSDV